MYKEDYFCTVEQAKKLKEFGIRQESLFYWTHSKWGIMPATSINFKGNPTSLFMATDLGDLLPDLLNTDMHQYELVVIKEGIETWTCEYCRANNLLDAHPLIVTIGHVSLAAALADMLIQLLQKGLATAEECNKRLTES